MEFDLLSVSQTGGCSAKLPAGLLDRLLADIPLKSHPDIMVDIETHDDAGVYRLNDSTALIVTTDFFPPLCSDARTFGRIAACNALSDVYAMGGTPLLTLNLTLFPAEGIPLEVLHDILLGGQEMVNAAGAFTMGGHTIVDAVPKYGLAVVGTVAPEKLVTNAAAQAGDVLVLTKALGAGVLVAAHRLGLADENAYREALEQMCLLNAKGAEVMRNHGIRCATDITGFGLMGHACKMAAASGKQLHIDTASLPVLSGVLQLLQDGCVPGAAFKNLAFAKPHLQVGPGVSLERKMLCADAQTSGGLLMCVPPLEVPDVLQELQAGGYPYACVVGGVSGGAGVVLD
ncbi:MAG: selenide, water dikinase SelD [Bacteroides sp.]|nr:selenide, water dikinase SelD [Bacteroides sp.]MCM1085965.1 selenide, water dikinase SelD [Bacteroides sp.]